MTEKNTSEKIHKINDVILLNVDSFLLSRMKESILRNAVHIPGFDMNNVFYWSQDPERFDLKTMTFLDYVYFKAKEYVLNVLLLESTLTFDSKDGLYTKLYDILYNYLILGDSDYNKKKNDSLYRNTVISDSDYYKDLRKFIIDIKKKLSPDSSDEARINSKSLGTLEHYFRYLNRESQQSSELLCRLGFPQRENPYFHFKKNCTEKASPALFENSLLFMHFLLEDQKDLLPSTYFPYVGITAAHFKGKRSVDERCVSFIRQYETEGKKHGNSNSIFRNIYEKYGNLYDDIQNSLNNIQKNYGEQSYYYTTNAFMFNHLTHAEFFHSLLQSSLYLFFERKIDFMGLKQACQEDAPNIVAVDMRYDFSESLFYIQLLEKMMTFDIDLRMLEKLDFRSRISVAGLPKEYEFLIVSFAFKAIYDFLNEVHRGMGPLLNHILKVIESIFPLRSDIESKEILNSISSLCHAFSSSLSEDAPHSIDSISIDVEGSDKYKLIVAYLLNSSCGNRVLQI